MESIENLTKQYRQRRGHSFMVLRNGLSLLQQLEAHFKEGLFPLIDPDNLESLYESQFTNKKIEDKEGVHYKELQRDAYILIDPERYLSNEDYKTVMTILEDKKEDWAGKPIKYDYDNVKFFAVITHDEDNDTYKIKRVVIRYCKGLSMTSKMQIAVYHNNSFMSIYSSFYKGKSSKQDIKFVGEFNQNLHKLRNIISDNILDKFTPKKKSANVFMF